jgi:hypothetical protein
MISYRTIGGSSNIFGCTYSQLLGDSGGTLDGAGLEGEHRLIALFMPIA